MLRQEYSKVFNELFFNVSSNERIKDVLEEVDDMISRLIIKFMEVLNEMLLGDDKEDEITDIVIILIY